MLIYLPIIPTEIFTPQIIAPVKFIKGLAVLVPLIRFMISRTASGPLALILLGIFILGMPVGGQRMYRQMTELHSMIWALRPEAGDSSWACPMGICLLSHLVTYMYDMLRVGIL